MDRLCQSWAEVGATRRNALASSSYFASALTSAPWCRQQMQATRVTGLDELTVRGEPPGRRRAAFCFAAAVNR